MAKKTPHTPSSTEAPKPPEAAKSIPDERSVPWNPWWGVTFTLIVFLLSQATAQLAIFIYPAIKHWTFDQTATWFNNSVVAQFSYIVVANILCVLALAWFVKRRKASWRSLGLRRPRVLDFLFGLGAAPLYFIIYLLAVKLVSVLFSGFDPEQQQQIGFDSVKGTVELTLTFIGLVIVTPIVEEIIFRGFIYSSLKKALRIIPAAILTSILFAGGHLLEGGEGGLLYIAAVDTFVLSLVLIFLREKTGSLWSGITLHAVKNVIAFAALFLFNVR